MKKTLTVLFSLVLAVGFLVYSPKDASALLYTINSATDGPFTVGDYTVSGVTEGSGTGLNYEVLKFSPETLNFPHGVKVDTFSSFDGATAEDPLPISPAPNGDTLAANDQAPHGDVDVGDLWGSLTSNGFTSVSALIFGFDVNEDGATSTNPVTVSSLIIRIYSDATNFTEWNLDTGADNSVSVLNYGTGSGNSEGNFQINLASLGYDFMTTFNASSTQKFVIQATHGDYSDGFEEYFLRGAVGQQQPPVIPEPTTMLLFSTGLVGAFLKRKMFA